jgi:flagellar assembly factor FliW
VYMQENPNFVPTNVKTVLTKEEKNLKERWENCAAKSVEVMLILKLQKNVVLLCIILVVYKAPIIVTVVKWRKLQMLLGYGEKGNVYKVFK